jgi:methylated-DNA-[protein]-cysteine S-methyltransferase
MQLHLAYLSSPIGTIEIKGNEEGILSIYFLDDKKRTSNKIHPSLLNCVHQLEEYFTGERKQFDLKLNLEGTEFQNRVWNQLTKIPYGRTSTYLEISKKLGDALATRAVGNANGSNPISIIIPCHRVIGVNGKLVGYGGGLWRKEWLLKHEVNIVWGRQESLF